MPGIRFITSVEGSPADIEKLRRKLDGNLTEEERLEEKERIKKIRKQFEGTRSIHIEDEIERYKGKSAKQWYELYKAKCEESEGQT